MAKYVLLEFEDDAQADLYTRYLTGKDEYALGDSPDFLGQVVAEFKANAVSSTAEPTDQKAIGVRFKP